MEQKIGATELRQRLTDVLQAVREERASYIIETFERSQAALINLDEYRQFQRYRQERETFFEWLEATAAQNAESNQGLSEAQVMITAWREDRFTALSSAETRAELAAVLARPKIQRLAVAPFGELVQRVERFTLSVHGKLDLSGACCDLKDDKFLACAVEGGAHYLVSSGHDLLDVKRYQDVGILNSGQFFLALELYSIDAGEMVQRFECGTLIGIHDTIPLEPTTAFRLEAALEMFVGEDDREG